MSRLSLSVGLLAVSLMLSGCGGSGSSRTDLVPADPPPQEPGEQTPPHKLDPSKSYGQKGPYQPGGRVQVWRLGADGLAEGATLDGEVGEDGAIELSASPDWDGPALVEVTGSFFDEASGNFSAEPLSLRGILQAQDGQLIGNVNLFTHLLAARVAARMDAESEGYETARDWALSEAFTPWLGIDFDPASLNLLQAPAGLEQESTALLLFSTAFLQTGLGQDELDEMTEDFATDFPSASSGYGHFRQIISAAQQHGEQWLADAQLVLTSMYGTQPPAHAAPDNYGWLALSCAAWSAQALCDGEPGAKMTVAGNSQGSLVMRTPYPGKYSVTARSFDTIPAVNSRWGTYGDPGFVQSRRSCPKTHDTRSCLYYGTSTVSSSDMRRGEPTYFLYRNAGNDPVSFEVIYSLVSDGVSNDPVRLVLGKEHDGRIGKRTYQSLGPWAYYAFSLPAAADPLNVRVSVANDCGLVAAPDLSLQVLILPQGDAALGPERVRATGCNIPVTASFQLEGGADYQLRIQKQGALDSDPVDSYHSFTLKVELEP